MMGIAVLTVLWDGQETGPRRRELRKNSFLLVKNEDQT
jgi:hypothetical protein